METPKRQIRAVHDDATITVYQAYRPEIGAAAVAAGRFVPPFRRDRMTWIKPSFLWMMYRCGWAEKPGQEVVLAIRLRRDGFEAALREAVLSHYDSERHASRAQWSRAVKRSDVRVQWDPERSVTLTALPYRSLQVGLSGRAVERYVDEWTVGIEDVTPLARAVRAGDTAPPPERPYPLPPEVGAVIGATG